MPLQKFFPGNSEMAIRMREFDWSKSELGLPDLWPHNLRMALRICLTSQFPIVLCWGPTYRLFYNDPYILFMGKIKHLSALSRPAQEIWPEIWPVISPMLDKVLNTGNASWSENTLLFFERDVPNEEVYVTFSYTPILGEDGEVEGIFCPCTETTQALIGARRLETLRDLGLRVVKAKTVEGACKLSAEVLAKNPYDIPFMAIYVADENGKSLLLKSSVGLLDPHPFPPSLALINISSLLDIKLSGGPWPEPVQKVMAIPISGGTHCDLMGFLIVGVSARRVFDEQYQSFFNLIAGHIGTAMIEAQTYEIERKHAEALAELNRAKTAFFSNVSHEFRTPLTLMLGPLENELSALSHPNSNLEMIHRNTIRLLKLVNTLLDFSRIEAGKTQAHFEPTDLAVFTTELASVFRSAIEKAGLLFTVKCEPLNENVYVDREMWEKIVLNLLSNAFKFTFEGEILIILQKVDERVQLTVQDTGVGVAANEVPRLFERFHRVEGIKARTHEGSGIGLALVEELVRLHGGEITASSELGKGTLFTVSLQLGKTHLPKENIKASQASRDRAVHASAFVNEALRWLPTDSISVTKENSLLNEFSDARILIVDDNADMREYLTRLLSERWFVESASDGEAALTIMHQKQFDLILTDIMMPKLDGFGLLKALRHDSAFKNIPVIMLSARTGEESRIEGLYAGADDYLIKPFSAREIIARVETHLKLSKRHQLMAENAILRAAKEEAEKNSYAKDLFLATLSHELRTPLTVILAWAQMLQMRKLDAKKKTRGIQLIEESALAQNQLIDDLLDVSKIIMGKFSIEMKNTNLIETLQKTIDSVRPMAEKKSIHIAEKLGSTQLFIFSDPARLRQIFWNLLSNAIKFTPEKGKIKITLKTLAEKVIIKIQDTGIGIKPEHLPYIFNRFHQADSSAIREHSGLGLGLSLVHSLLALQKGTVEAISAGENQGSIFIVTFPLVTHKKNSLDLSGLKILFIDDEEKMRETMRITLCSLGAQVQLVSSVGEALSIFQDFEPNVLISDIAMPKEDGYSLIQKIRQKSNVYAIALTAHAGIESQARAIAAGFDEHLAKPIEMTQLVQTILKRHPLSPHK